MAEPKRNTFQRLKKGQLNRKERRDLEGRLNTEDPGLEIVNRNVAGIDVGNESHYVAVPPSRDPQPVQEFGSWTTDLERMADWLKTCGIETVVMQSTGVYWIALYDVLEKRGFKRLTESDTTLTTDIVTALIIGTPFTLIFKQSRTPERTRRKNLQLGLLLVAAASLAAGVQGAALVAGLWHPNAITISLAVIAVASIFLTERWLRKRYA